MTGLRFPCQLPHVHPRGYPHMTQGHNGAVSPFMWGSFIPYSMPVYPGVFTLTPFTPPHQDAKRYVTLSNNLDHQFHRDHSILERQKQFLLIFPYQHS